MGKEREREGGKESRAIVFCLHFFFPFPSSSLRLTSSQSLSYFSFISHRLLLLVVVVVKDQLFFLYCAVFYYRWACDRWPIVFWLSSIVVRLFFLSIEIVSLLCLLLPLLLSSLCAANKQAVCTFSSPSSSHSSSSTPSPSRLFFHLNWPRRKVREEVKGVN